MRGATDPVALVGWSVSEAHQQLREATVTTGSPPWALPASLAGHAILFIALVLLAIRNVEPPRTRSIDVEIFSEAQYRAETAAPVPLQSFDPKAATTALAKPVDEPSPARVDLPSDGTIKATQLFTAAILKDPANREVRETLPTLERTERLTQLCNIEALEQIRLANPATVPDSMEAAAFAETKVTGLTVIAPGAAYRSRQKWYEAKFSCSVAADYLQVTEFSFSLGDPIPESEWDSHNLVAKDEDE
jgi:hypothetical protein